MKINIIGDIAGRYDELMLLLQKMPNADLTLSVGDMIDRGPHSRRVLEWFMNTKNVEALYGNHEDLMFKYAGGDADSWLYNGGDTTMANYLPAGRSMQDYTSTVDAMKDVAIPQEVFNWLRNRPLYFQTQDLFVSHAPITKLQNIPYSPYYRDDKFIWNRCEPRKPQSKFLIHGHNGIWKQHKFIDGSIFGLCIDDSHSECLTGIHWPTRERFSQGFLS